jgi:hypothetical protein
MPSCIYMDWALLGAATHPFEPEAPEPDGAEPVAPNPSHLPVEPQFAPDW